MTGATAARNKVFISYSRRDREWVERVRLHLRPLERDPALRIDIWDDSEIEAGEDWMAAIKSAIASARAVVLLVSAAFLASDFIESNELPPLLEAARKEGVVILPFHIKPSRFTKIPDLSQFQSVNDPAAPLIKLGEAEQEEALVKLADAVELAFSQEQTAGRKPAAQAARDERDTERAIRALPRVQGALDELNQILRDKLGGDDSLYLPAALIAESVFIDGLRAVAHRAHPKQLARRLSLSLALARQHVSDSARPLETSELRTQLIRYATGATDITSLVQTALGKNQFNSAVLVEVGQQAADEWKTVNGMRFRSGFLSPDFIPANESREIVLENVFILITHKKLSAEEDVDRIIGEIVSLNQGDTTHRNSLLIVAGGIEGAALRRVLSEKNLIITAVRCTGFGYRRTATFFDSALLSGGMLFGTRRSTPVKAAWLPCLGRADKAVVNESETYLAGTTSGRTRKTLIGRHVEKIRRQRAKTSDGAEREWFTARLNNYEGGVTIIRVGGRSDEERRRRIEHVRRVVRHYDAARVAGVVAGEHLALVNAAAAVCARAEAEEQKRADVILSDALEAPLRLMAEEFARDGEETVRAVRARQLESGNSNVGYYGEEDSFVDLFEVGAVVPAENVVTLMREAVEAAVERLAALRFTDEVVREVAALDAGV